MGPKPVCRALEIPGSKVRCLSHYCITQVGGRLEELFACTFMDWLSGEHGRIWRCSCSWLEPHLRLSYWHSSGGMPGISTQGWCHVAGALQHQSEVRAAQTRFCWPGEQLQAVFTCATPQFPEGKSDICVQKLPDASMAMFSCLGATHVVFCIWLVPLCPVTVLGRKQPEDNCREFPKSERGGKKRESARKQGDVNDAVSLGETDIK